MRKRCLGGNLSNLFVRFGEASVIGSFLSSSLFLGDLLDLSSDFFGESLIVASLLGEPWVSLNLFQGNSAAWVVFGHFLKEILEFIGEGGVGSVLVEFPEFLVFLLGKPVVVLAIDGISLSEGEISVNQNIKSDGQRENISGSWVISGSLWESDQLRSTVWSGAQNLGAVASSIITESINTEAPIGEFDLVVSVDDNVLWLDVSVVDLSLVGMVKSRHQLLENLRTINFTKRRIFSKNITEIALRAIFHWQNVAVVLNHGLSGLGVFDSEDVWMLQSFQGSHFGFAGGFNLEWFFLKGFEHLQGNHFTGGSVLGLIDSAGATLSGGLDQFVLLSEGLLTLSGDHFSKRRED